MAEPVDCLFCKLRDGGPKHVYDDEGVFALEDIHPQAPVHLLILPRKHIAGPATLLSEEDEAMVGHLVAVAGELARERGIAETGYRLVLNCNEHGGQTVLHLHMHLLGGRQMTWPPG